MPAPTGNVIIVCTANICRSPMGERLLQHALKAETEPLKSINVISAGVAAEHGHAATNHSVSSLKKVGINLTNHSSQPLTQEMLDSAIAVFCMTESHRAMIEIHFDRVPHHVYLFRQFIGTGREAEIPDPYGFDLKDYDACRDSMVEAVPSLIRFLKELKNHEAGSAPIV